MSRHEGTAPLLANEDPRDSFDEEERALLLKEENKQIRRERRRMVLCLGLAIILTSSAVAFTFFFAKKSLGRSRNVIMMVSDGFGPASQTYGRSFSQFVGNKAMDDLTALDKILVGSSRTRSSNSLVTDSAAGATAFACALKTYNGAIGDNLIPVSLGNTGLIIFFPSTRVLTNARKSYAVVDPNGTPCGTILEAAKNLGMLTGLVVTSRVTDATPASFSAHVASRAMESEIAEQQIGFYTLGRQIDLLLGGGSCFFLPNTTGGCRNDDRDLIKESKEKGWETVMMNRDDLEQNKDENNALVLPALGLFSSTDLSFEIDRNHTQQPSLLEMTETALASLESSAKTNQGFFLMIEGSRIDLGGHYNDPVAHVHEILMYHATVKAVQKFVSKHPNTLLISTSDHETGGFTLGVQNDPNTYPDYLWRPEVIAKAKASTEALTWKLVQFLSEDHSNKQQRAFVKSEILKNGLGITDAEEEEIAFLADSERLSPEILRFLGHAISKRANLGWTTMGHTGIDVNLYAQGDSDAVASLRGNRENTDIGRTMRDYLSVDLDYITRLLNKYVDPTFSVLN
ncbi:hypothetical protein BGZ70_007325 [Mortierella alpina]|uniref:Alkaline phosphatase n=1 Tax=Mortierella alpina TaxID=64518 RepID=A0A9P6J6L9_MORAP|nr:hypothetical protein BGZ70_007325 [Mortierella alpina]